MKSLSAPELTGYQVGGQWHGRHNEQYRQSKFICSGPQNPRVGGVIIANVGIDEAREIMKKDPFTIHGASEYHFLEFTPGKGKYDDRFACFVK